MAHGCWLFVGKCHVLCLRFATIIKITVPVAYQLVGIMAVCDAD